MSYVDKLLGIAGMGSTIANVSLLRRLWSDVTVVIALTAISGALAGMVMTIGLYGLYQTLTHYGLDPQVGAVTVGILTLIVTSVLAALAIYRLRRLQELPRLMNDAPIIGQVGKLADAFVDGFLGDRGRRDGL